MASDVACEPCPAGQRQNVIARQWRKGDIGRRRRIDPDHFVNLGFRRDVADHIDHVVQIAGAEHAGIGGDLDGITSTPEGLDSVAAYPTVFAELIRRGYTDEQLKGIAGLNVLRVMRKAEAVAAKLQKERPASDVRIEEVDKPVAVPPSAAN